MGRRRSRTALDERGAEEDQVIVVSPLSVLSTDAFPQIANGLQTTIVPVLPLLHKRVLITRTRHQASDLAAQLETLGATCILIPAIQIIPPDSFEPFDKALAKLHTFDWLLFTSVNAVEIFAQRLNKAEIDRSGNSFAARTLPVKNHHSFPRIAVIGPATARAVHSAGFTVDLMPPEYIAESLSAALTPFASGARMLFLRAAEARDHLPEALTAAGAQVTIAEAYRNQMPSESIPALQHLFSNPALYPDAITFTSASSVRNLTAILEASMLVLDPKIVLASIGPITSQALRDLGLNPNVEAATPTIPSLIDALVAAFSPV
jgi:uroporphyrinogen-III synthase